MPTFNNTQTVRYGPAFDPIRRQHLSSFARWMLLFSLVLGIVGFVGNMRIDSHGTISYERNYYLLEHCLAAFCSAVLVIGGLRLLLFPLLKEWYDATDALRDWMAVGLISGVCYGGAISLSLRLGRPEASNHELWMQERFVLACLSSFVGILLARVCSLAPNAISGRGFAAPFVVLLQVGLMGVSLWYTLWGIRYLLNDPNARIFCLVGFSTALLISICILGVAYTQERELYRLRREGKPESGVGSANMILQVTIIGGTHAGKTCFLAGAYQEWSRIARFPNIAMVPILPKESTLKIEDSSVKKRSLEDIANQIYAPPPKSKTEERLQEERLPKGTQDCSNFAFQLRYRHTTVAEFRILDYPGGILYGEPPSEKAQKEFHELSEYTDLLLIVVDMEALRLRERSSEALEIKQKYVDTLQRIANRNGSKRVVPVALVLTKSDEYRDGNELNKEAIKQDLREYGFDDMERIWTSLAFEEEGPKHTEFSTWYSSAFTHTEPYRDEKEEIRYRPASEIKPTNCAAPLFWLCAQAMRWNATLCGGMLEWILGSSRPQREFRKAMLYMEVLAQKLHEEGLTWRS